MELFIELRDHKEKIRNKFKSQFGMECNLDDLQKKISSKLAIDFEDQRLSFDGKNINGLSDRSIQSFGLKNGSTLIAVFADYPECPTLNIKCEKTGPEDYGVRGGLICRVSKSEDVSFKYYVKEHMGPQQYSHADIRELFVYKFLELIRVGPTVHFIPNVHYSSIGLYIGTEEVVDFRRADTEGLDISQELYAQRDLIRRVLFVKDLHPRNFGIDVDGNLRIVNLKVKDTLDSTAVHKYLDGFQVWKGRQETRIRVAKESIESWNFLENMNKANDAIAMKKELFRKHFIGYKPSRNFDDYFIQIQNNLRTLIDRLNQIC